MLMLAGIKYLVHALSCQCRSCQGGEGAVRHLIASCCDGKFGKLCSACALQRVMHC